MPPSASSSSTAQLAPTPPVKPPTNDHVSVAYNNLSETYTTSNPLSLATYTRATSSLPGGNTRTVLFYAPFPLSIVRASGSTLYDADGHEYIDLLGEYTAGLYGHSHPVILEAIQNALSKGLNFGSHHEDEWRLAEAVKERFLSLELIRFANSGTEANLMALAVAKAWTGRKKVLVFNGGYHGGVFVFANGGSEVNVPHDWVVARYNDVEGAGKLFEEHGSELAAVLVEPMLGSGGGIPGTKEFLQLLRRKSEEVGALLIFDEVMTSRLFEGKGVQGKLGIRPDLTTLGKYIGGGMSFGAFGGRADVMGLFDPRSGRLPHAGTFNNNVLTMAAGRAGLEELFTQKEASELHQRGENLRKRLNEVGKGTQLKATGCGSILVIHFTGTPVEAIRSPDDLKSSDPSLSNLLHLYLLARGLYIARRGFLALSLVLMDSDLDKFVAAIRSFVEEYRHLIGL